MKNSISALSVFLIFSCGQKENPQIKSKTDSLIKGNFFSQSAEAKKIKTSDTASSKHQTTLDTVVIKTENGIVRKFDKKTFNKIVDTHPEFFDGVIQSPEALYYMYGKNFGSEAGQDTYCLLYAYFIKQRNPGVEKAEQRTRLTDIYLNINSIFGYLSYGGTYFGHQEARLPAESEYSIYVSSDQDNLTGQYDISKQKKLYMQSLRQRIADEVTADNSLTHQEKIERIKKIDTFVDNINHLITNAFYLKWAQHFQYKYY